MRIKEKLIQAGHFLSEFQKCYAAIHSRNRIMKISKLNKTLIPSPFPSRH